ncbi:MAG: bifunctional [glutamate--ammonia ligase]-adenylyl-L-tyrosine phosphorylase/[glutamate--ammonia-ligase] adenylyltransferase, partial [Polyangiales bacterium]
TPHADGAGYELDTRLRPSGEQGHLVVSLDSFRAYHVGEEGAAGPRAQDWERQALLRLRACGGDASVGEKAEAIARVAGYDRGPIDPVELLRLRERLEVEVARERAGRHDVKLGRGGLADVEFAVQYLQMQSGRDDAVRTPETLVALDVLEARGTLKPAHAGTLRDGYRFLRRLEQRARVVHGARSALLEESAPGLTPLARSMGYRDGPTGAASQQLVEAYREITNEVRAAFLEVVR